MEKKDILSGNIMEYFNQGIIAKKNGSYNSAISLFFKALAVLADYHILQVNRSIPKSHAERFRILEESFPEIYNLLDKDFPVYQDSYQLKLTKEIAEVLENDVKKLARQINFRL